MIKLNNAAQWRNNVPGAERARGLLFSIAPFRKCFLSGAIFVISLFGMTSPANAQVVFGNASYEVAGGTVRPAPSFRVKFCKADPNKNFALIPGACTTSSTPTNSSGFYELVLENGVGWYYMYTWRNDWSWGSETYPVSEAVFVDDFLDPFATRVDGFSSKPRALPPVPVNPAHNAFNQPISFTLKWSDGLDSQRRDPRWPVTYDIYASGNEFPENLVFSNIPCNGTGTCSVNVSGLAYTTRYQWRVVAKIRSATPIPNFGDTVHLTNSATFKFSTGFDPSTPTYSFRTDNGRYLNVPNGGGGDFNATTTFISPLTSQFKIIDVNGGSLMSGDTVHIQTSKNYYLMAFGGGGGDVATSAWAQAFETFRIIKVGGTGQIGNGSSVALLGPNGIHYLVAENGGGGTVNCNRTSIGPWETFTLVQ